MAALALAAPASAAIPQGNVVVNPGAEGFPGVTDETSHACPPGWTCGETATAVRYGVTTFPSLAEAARIGGGDSFFAGGPGGTENLQVMFQGIPIDGIPEIADGNVRATVSACLGGFLDQNDVAGVVLVFESGGVFPATEGRVDLGPVTAADRQNQTTLVSRTGSTAIGSAAATALLGVQFERTSGVYNDAYADNIGVSFGVGANPPPATDCERDETGGGGGGDPGGGGGDPGGGGEPGGGATEPTRTLGFGKKATILTERERLRTKLVCNTQQVERCEGLISANLVKTGGPVVRAAKPVALGTYSVGSLRTSTVKLELTRRGEKKLPKLSAAKLAKRGVELTATTELGTSSITDSATLALKRKG